MVITLCLAFFYQNIYLINLGSLEYWMHFRLNLKWRHRWLPLWFFPVKHLILMRLEPYCTLKPTTNNLNPQRKCFTPELLPTWQSCDACRRVPKKAKQKKNQMHSWWPAGAKSFAYSCLYSTLVCRLWWLATVFDLMSGRCRLVLCAGSLMVPQLSG